MRIFRRIWSEWKMTWQYRKRHNPPNPHEPDFASPGGAELWRMTLDIYYRMGKLEGKLAFGVALLLGMFAAIMGKLLEAY